MTVGLRSGVLGVVALGGVGLVGELALAEHVQEPVQLVPFAVAAALAAASAVGLRGDGPPVSRLGAAVGASAALVGGFGCWEHFEHNLEFEAEVHAAEGTAANVVAACFGAGPVLAPGALALLGALLWLATRPSGPSPAR